MPSGELAISVRGLSKRYTIQSKTARATSLGEALYRRLRSPFKGPETRAFWALKDVNFDVYQGDVVGIIGRNGAGKSTLLKILSRITEPTEGTADLYGRVGSLLEVGTGFHLELTGRENIYLNGSLLGMRRREIERQFDAIVEFSGVEQFLDVPLKRYSSGMSVRLAFAVAAHLASEILVVDEVLAVGDAEFQKKCLGKMHDVAHSGRTVFFVSHNLASVTNLCTRGIVLQQGQVRFSGDTEPAVEMYLKTLEEARAESGDLAAHRAAWAAPLITAARILDRQGTEQARFGLGEDVTLEIEFRSPERQIFRSPCMGVVVNHSTFGAVAEVSTQISKFEAEGGPYPSGVMRCTLHDLPLLPGEYSVDVMLGESLEYLDTVNGYLTFELEATDIYGSGRSPVGQQGVVYLQPTWGICRG